jgi:hypothetical protein
MQGPLFKSSMNTARKIERSKLLLHKATEMILKVIMLEEEQVTKKVTTV